MGCNNSTFSTEQEIEREIQIITVALIDPITDNMNEDEKINLAYNYLIFCSEILQFTALININAFNNISDTLKRLERHKDIVNNVMLAQLFAKTKSQLSAIHEFIKEKKNLIPINCESNNVYYNFSSNNYFGNNILMEEPQYQYCPPKKIKISNFSNIHLDLNQLKYNNNNYSKLVSKILGLSNDQNENISDTKIDSCTDDSSLNSSESSSNLFNNSIQSINQLQDKANSNLFLKSLSLDEDRSYESDYGFF